MNNPDNIINASKSFNAECEKIIEELKKGIAKDSSKGKVNNGLINIVREIQATNTGSDPISLRVLNDKISKMLNSIEVMRTKDTREIIEYVTEVITRRTDAIDGTIATLTKIKDKLISSDITVKEAQEIINQEIERSFASVTERLKAAGSTDAELKNAIDWVECTGASTQTVLKDTTQVIFILRMKN